METFVMKWFKHLSDKHRDRDLMDAYDKFSHIAYKFYYTIHELYALYYNELDEEDYLKISYKNITKNIQIRYRKIRELLLFFNERNLIISKVDKDFAFIKIPQFIELASNWTREKIRDESKNSEVAVKVEVEVKEKKEVNVEKIKKDALLSKDDDLLIKDAKDILIYLNACSGKKFTDYKHVLSMLKKGYKFEKFIMIINNKLKDKFFIENKRLLNPVTLFKEEKFDIYANENMEKDEKCV